jgi:hypothetical protein
MLHILIQLLGLNVIYQCSAIVIENHLQKEISFLFHDNQGAQTPLIRVIEQIPFFLVHLFLSSQPPTQV